MIALPFLLAAGCGGGSSSLPADSGTPDAAFLDDDDWSKGLTMTDKLVSTGDHGVSAAVKAPLGTDDLEVTVSVVLDAVQP